MAGTDGNVLLKESDGSYAIGFTNEGTLAATLISFEVDYGSQRLFIRDVGKFSPGVTIQHVYKRRGGQVTSSPLFGGGAKLTCSVAAAHFIDNSEWTPGAVGAQDIPAVLGDGYLGIEMRQTAMGVVIDVAYPTAAARKAGLTQADVILTIDEQRVGTVVQAQKLISVTPPGEPLEVTVRRNGVERSFIVIVGGRPTVGPLRERTSTNTG